MGKLKEIIRTFYMKMFQLLKELKKSTIFKSQYTGAPVVGTPILGTYYIVSYDAEMCGAERESSGMIQGRMH